MLQREVISPSYDNNYQTSKQINESLTRLENLRKTFQIKETVHLRDNRDESIKGGTK